MALNIQPAAALDVDKQINESVITRLEQHAPSSLHTDAVYTTLIRAAATMEQRLSDSLNNYREHPDVQANLQQLQYDLQSWNLALTTMTNIQKNMADALASIANNFK